MARPRRPVRRTRVSLGFAGGKSNLINSLLQDRQANSAQDATRRANQYAQILKDFQDGDLSYDEARAALQTALTSESNDTLRDALKTYINDLSNADNVRKVNKAAEDYNTGRTTYTEFLSQVQKISDGTPNQVVRDQITKLMADARKATNAKETARIVADYQAGATGYQQALTDLLFMRNSPDQKDPAEIQKLDAAVNSLKQNEQILQDDRTWHAYATGQLGPDAAAAYFNNRIASEKDPKMVDRLDQMAQNIVKNEAAKGNAGYAYSSAYRSRATGGRSGGNVSTPTSAAIDTQIKTLIDDWEKKGGYLDQETSICENNGQCILNAWQRYGNVLEAGAAMGGKTLLYAAMLDEFPSRAAAAVIHGVAKYYQDRIDSAKKDFLSAQAGKETATGTTIEARLSEVNDWATWSNRALKDPEAMQWIPDEVRTKMFRDNASDAMRAGLNLLSTSQQDQAHTMGLIAIESRPLFAELTKLTTAMPTTAPNFLFAGRPTLPAHTQEQDALLNMLKSAGLENFTITPENMQRFVGWLQSDPGNNLAAFSAAFPDVLKEDAAKVLMTQIQGVGYRTDTNKDSAVKLWTLVYGDRDWVAYTESQINPGGDPSKIVMIDRRAAFERFHDSEHELNHPIIDRAENYGIPQPTLDWNTINAITPDFDNSARSMAGAWKAAVEHTQAERGQPSRDQKYIEDLSVKMTEGGLGSLDIKEIAAMLPSIIGNTLEDQRREFAVSADAIAKASQSRDKTAQMVANPFEAFLGAAGKQIGGAIENFATTPVGTLARSILGNLFNENVLGPPSKEEPTYIAPVAHNIGERLDEGAPYEAPVLHGEQERLDTGIIQPLITEPYVPIAPVPSLPAPMVNERVNPYRFGEEPVQPYNYYSPEPPEGIYQQPEQPQPPSQYEEPQTPEEPVYRRGGNY